MIDKSLFIRQLAENLTENILPFWMNKMVDPRGGFYGCRDGSGRIVEEAMKGSVMNARILWSFSASYRHFPKPDYLIMASRAKEYIMDHFYDSRNGGVYWSVNPDGTPSDTRKQIYALAFTLYAMSEYHSATGDSESLKIAIDLFNDIETHSRDADKGGYMEALAEDWSPLVDMRLSQKDENAPKTMNTHLHILEGYTALMRVWNSPRLKEAVRSLMDIFLKRIVRDDGHLGLFFNNNWKPLDGIQSFGHDVEASWLLLEAAHVLGDKTFIPVMREACERIVMAGLEGLRKDSSMDYERLADGSFDTEKHWWVQAESVVAQVYLYRYHRCEPALQSAWNSWQYILANLVDKEEGEWYWSLKGGEINRDGDKAGFWKCPYHNSRMCLEVITQLKNDK